ncbi:hypothetical protein ACQCX2_15655 [Propionibacteriaceae bacterium Y1700]|uniref:hypothetical protein n=1 Tax=Microlunatus sp. Y1700 TaxID=3418487 RepID=UPI003DA791D1
MSEVEKLAYDIDWFATQVKAWRGFHLAMGERLLTLQAMPPIPALSERFPANLAAASKDMRDVVDVVKNSLNLAQESATSFADALQSTAEAYARQEQATAATIEKFHRDIAPNPAPTER